MRLVDHCAECRRPMPEYPEESFLHMAPLCADCFNDLTLEGCGTPRVHLDDRIREAAFDG